MATAKRHLTDPRVQGPRPKKWSGSQLLTVDEVAQRLSVSVAYVRRCLVFERRIPVVKIGRLVRIDERDLEAFIDEGRVTPHEYDFANIGNGRRRRRASGGK